MFRGFLNVPVLVLSQQNLSSSEQFLGFGVVRCPISDTFVIVFDNIPSFQ